MLKDDKHIDYQLKREELLKETIFLTEGREKEKEMVFDNIVSKTDTSGKSAMEEDREL